MFHLISPDSLLTTSHLVYIIALVFSVVTILLARTSQAAEVAHLRQLLDLTEAKHSSVVDDLNKNAQKDRFDALTLLQVTKKELKDTQNALGHLQRISATHSEFRDALANELSHTRAQRNWSTTGVRISLDALEEAERKVASQEFTAWELQNQIRFKANELHDMTLSLDSIKKELALANTFSQEAQDKIDEQENLLEESRETILGLLNQIRDHKMGCRCAHSTIERPNLGVDSVFTELENTNQNLAQEAEYWRAMSQSWSINSANTIHAMASEIEEVRGQLAEVNAENERLARDLEALVKHVEDFDEGREFTTQQVRQPEWSAIASNIDNEEDCSTDDVDMSVTKEEEGEGEGDDHDPSWFPNEGGEYDGMSYDANRYSGEELEWFTQPPVATGKTEHSEEWYTEGATLIKDGTKNEDQDQWIEDADTLVNSEDEFGGNNLYEPLYSEEETLATSRVERQDKGLVSASGWACNNYIEGQSNW
ncbi:hypothetical protein ACET3X_006783 [Alternaria dauci]|uniref:Uncharacterized protein n=1 Tax=Alternaria dauci TaxID=48095 RepID=A0ABR3UFI0_9PLEO